MPLAENVDRLSSGGTGGFQEAMASRAASRMELLTTPPHCWANIVSKEPQGVIAIMTTPEGHVIATAADFDRQSYGGFKLWEAQRMRAKKQAIYATIRAYCSDAIVEAIDSYLSEQIGEALRRKGHTLTLRAIGYPEDVTAEVQR